jgi:hypothetical protein
MWQGACRRPTAEAAECFLRQLAQQVQAMRGLVAKVGSASTLLPGKFLQGPDVCGVRGFQGAPALWQCVWVGWGGGVLSRASQMMCHNLDITTATYRAVVCHSIAAS